MLVTGGLQKRLMLVGEFYVNVLQTWRKRADFRHGNAMVPELMAQALHIKTLVNERMDGLPENRGAANPGNMAGQPQGAGRSEEHTSELQSHSDLVCRLLLEKKNTLEKSYSTTATN